MACDFQQCGILTSVDSDESVQSPFKLRNSKLCSTSSLSHKIFKRLAHALIRLRYAQAGLSLCWSYMPHCWKSHVVAHIYKLESKAKIKNQYNQVPHLHQDTIWESENTHRRTKRSALSQQVITKAARNSKDRKKTNLKDK